MDSWIAAIDRIHAGRSDADGTESAGLEFKRPTDSVRDTQHEVADAAVCLANGSGGVVVLGVQDRLRGRAALVGTDMEASELRRRIYEITKPNLDVRVVELTRHGVRFLVTHVDEGLDVFTARQRVPTRRFGDRCLAMTTAEISRLHDERRGADWSGVDSGRGLDDADSGAVEQARLLLQRASRDAPNISNLSRRDLLALLGLLTEHSTLNRAGELLLCHGQGETERELIVYQRRDTLGGEVTFGRRWDGPLLIAFLEVMSAIEARVSTTPLNLASGQQIQLQDYPVAALREAIANAVMHGDHRELRPIQIEHAPEGLEVRSPGPLVTGITPANILTHPAKARFATLAEAMRSLGLAEKWGQGVDRMYREMIRSGRDVPTVAVETDQAPETVVRFLGGAPNSRIARFISTLPPAEQDDVDALLIVSVLTRRKTVSAARLSPVVQRTPEATEAVLRRLTSGEAQLLESTPRTRGRSQPDYQLRTAAIAALGPAVRYRSKPAKSDAETKLTEHVAEYGWVNNATVQRMFDMDVHAAHDVLKDLLTRDVIVRTSEQTRGTAVRYGPGPAFAPASRIKRQRKAT